MRTGPWKQSFLTKTREWRKGGGGGGGPTNHKEVTPHLSGSGVLLSGVGSEHGPNEDLLPAGEPGEMNPASHHLYQLRATTSEAWGKPWSN